jgi:RecJ-like exonuclease
MEDLNLAAESDTVIVCDISLPENKLTQVLDRFSELSEKGSLTYIDHHPLPETVLIDDIPGKVVYNSLSSTSELAYSFFQDRLDPLHARKAIYGAIADYLDNTPLIQILLRRWDKRTLYLETGILVQGVESLGRNDEFRRRIANNLANNSPPSRDEELVRMAIQYTRREWEVVSELKGQTKVEGRIAYTLNFPFSLGKTATYLSGIRGILVGIAGEKRRENIDMSLRTCDENIDLNALLRKIAPEMGGSGGGHPMAAGARVPEKNFEKLLRELNANLESKNKVKSG